MVTWQQFDQSADLWDAFLLRALDSNVFQSYAWGEYKRALGWEPLRFIATTKADVVGMAQVLLKKPMFGFGIAWSPGGPVFEFNKALNLGVDLTALIKQLHSRYPGVLIRFDSYSMHNCVNCYDFRKACRRPFYNINSGFTLLNKLGPNYDYQSEMTSKHRYYCRKASSSPIRWACGVTDRHLNDFTKVHQQMVHSKKKKLSEISNQDLIKLREILGERSITLLIGYLDGHPVTSCLTYDFGRKSIYTAAATSDVGRKVCAAYAMIPKLFSLLQAKGIEVFDFGGIDPGNSTAEGVNHFKRGFGGKVVEHLGEWESACSEGLRIALNIGLKKFGGLA